MNSEERRIAVLRAIVADFVATNEPVGSKGIVDRHNLGVSSATVRNDMAALEDEGYIIQPHTSAGRIPTDKGYRLFVDRLAQIKPLSPAERKAISTFLEGAVDLRRRAAPQRAAARAAHPPGGRRAVPDALPLDGAPPRGRLADPRPPDAGAHHRHRPGGPAGRRPGGRAHRRRRRAPAPLLNSVLVGQPLTTAAARVAALPEEGPDHLRQVITTLSSVLVESLVEHPEERLVLGGTANLARQGADATSLRGCSRPSRSRWSCCACSPSPATRRRSRCASARRTRPRRCGRPPRSPSATARSPPRRRGARRHGRRRPTRMDYPSTIAAVRAVARYVGEIVGGA